MNPYLSSFQQAKNQADSAKQERETKAQQLKTLQDEATARAEAFLKSTVVQEVTSAVEALEKIGIAADVGNGQGEGGVRCSLLFHNYSGSLIFTASHGKDRLSGTIAPQLKYCDHGGPLQIVDMDPRQVREIITAYVAGVIPKLSL